MKRAYRPWTNHEVETIERMAKAGKSNRKIALEIGRSQDSIAARARHYRPKRKKRIAEPVPYVLITLAEIVDYFEAGWRFADFDEDFYRFEWPHKSAPLWLAEIRKADDVRARRRSNWQHSGLQAHRDQRDAAENGDARAGAECIGADGAAHEGSIGVA